MSTISIDLAYRDYRDIGVAILESNGGQLGATFVAVDLPDAPNPIALASWLLDLCTKHSSRVLLLDGPQAWKSPENGLEHCRICERQLNTPAKTGLPGTAKPGNYLPFVAFSIAVFDELARRGWRRYANRSSLRASVAVESFPFSAWRSLGLPPLPAKRRTNPEHLVQRATVLAAAHAIEYSRTPSHDELQAVVSGLAGPAIEREDYESLEFFGVAPAIMDGTCREGFIVNPRNTHR